MPLVTRTAVLAWGLTTCLAAPAAAQYPGQSQPANWNRHRAGPASDSLDRRGHDDQSGGAARCCRPRIRRPLRPVNRFPTRSRPLPPSSQYRSRCRSLRKVRFLRIHLAARTFRHLPRVQRVWESCWACSCWWCGRCRRGMPQARGSCLAKRWKYWAGQPIGGKQNVHLVRCGNKIVLVNVSATSVETLTEITDPAEVDRLLEICRHSAVPAGAVQQLLGRFRRCAAARGARSTATGPTGFSPSRSRQLPPGLRRHVVISRLQLMKLGRWALCRGGRLLGLMCSFALAMPMPPVEVAVDAANPAPNSTIHANLASGQSPAPSVAPETRPVEPTPPSSTPASAAGPAQPLPIEQAAEPTDGHHTQSNFPLELPGGLGSPNEWTSPEGISSAIQTLAC